MFSNELVNIPYLLRSKTYPCKINFKSMYTDQQQLLCDLCGDHNDDQPSAIKCRVIINNLSDYEVNIQKVDHSHIYGSIMEQKEVTMVYKEALKVRNKLVSTKTKLVPKHSSQGAGGT